MVGKTLGHYEILEPLGAGGMGEVYRARDTTLKREVAIKVLPEDLAADPDRLARLEREAHLLAALNHPNIATIHSLDQVEETRFLVLELVKGESLEQRLGKGPLPTEAALDLCKQIAQALEAAHGEGIIHRDLKPANVLITPDGRAKVLDFGLAKAFEASPADGDITMSPTLTVAGTQTGVILGTAPYMSPEQVRGLPLDKRVDIWAFGCVLYEALTASRAFARETVADTLAAIIESEANWGALPGATPPAVVALVKRCLRKDPDRRLHDIADARIEIEEAINNPASEAAEVAPAATPRMLLGVVGGAALGAVAVWLALGLFGAGRAGLPTDPIRLQFRMPSEQTLSSPAFTNTLAISSDGSLMFYRATVEGTDAPQLLWRLMDGSEMGVVPDSESAVSPFLHPGDEWLGFIIDDVVFKWRIGSLRAERIGAVPGARRAAWATSGTIVVGHESDGLQTIADNGREPAVPLTVLNTERGDIGHRNPSFLPDGRVLFNIHDSGDMSFMLIAVTSLDDGDIEILDIQGANPRFISSGHLLFNRIPDIWAVAFDPQTTTLLGAAAAVLADVDQSRGRPNPKFDVSDSGTAVYQPMIGDPRSELVWVDLEGNTTPAGIPSGRPYFVNPRISPDGRSIAAHSRNLWIWDGARGYEFDVDGQLTFLEWASNEDVYYAGYWAAARGGSDVYRRGMATEETVFLRANSTTAEEWSTGSNPSPVDLSNDGEWLLFHNRTDRVGGDRVQALCSPRSQCSQPHILIGSVS